MPPGTEAAAAASVDEIDFDLDRPNAGRHVAFAAAPA
jgi:hypothetical protein